MNLPPRPDGSFWRRYGRHHQINNLHSGPVWRFSHGLIKHLHIDAQLSIVAGDNLYHPYAL